MTQRVLPTEQATDLATFKISSGGTELDGTFNVVSILVDRAANRIPTARISLKDGSAAREDFPLANRDELIPGREIEIAAGYHNDNQTIFKGVVIKQTVRVASDRTSILVIECKDPAYAMTVGRQNRYFADSTDSAAIEEVLGSRGLAMDVEATDIEHRTLLQYDSTDWDFIVSRADANGKLVLVDAGQVAVRSPDLAQDAVVTLLYGATLLSFDLTLDATHQHEAVTCASWDPATQQVSEVESAAAGVEETGNLSSGALSAEVTAGEVRHRHPGRLAPEELQAWANARNIRNTLAKVRGLIQSKGLAAVVPGAVIELAGCGDRFNGKVLVSAVRHTLVAGAWKIHVQVGLGPEPFAAAPGVRELPAGGLLPAVRGLQIGVATQLAGDPDGEHRVLVRMPVVDADAEGTWARVAAVDAGEGRGTFWRPEIGDELVLGFLDDDPRQPVVLGMLNSSNKPAPIDASDDNPEKGFVSREKLRFVFNDEVKSVQVDTPEGNSILLSEGSSGIVIQDQNDNKIELAPGGITLDSPGDVTIKAQGNVKVEGSNVELSAQSALNAKGTASVEVSSSGTAALKGAIVNIN